MSGDLVEVLVSELKFQYNVLSVVAGLLLTLVVILICYIGILLNRCEKLEVELNQKDAEIQRLNDILWFTEDGGAMTTDNRGIRE